MPELPNTILIEEILDGVREGTILIEPSLSDFEELTGLEKLFACGADKVYPHNDAQGDRVYFREKSSASKSRGELVKKSRYSLQRTDY